MFPTDSDCVGWDDRVRGQIEDLQAEVARFRAALERIESWTDEDPSKVFSVNAARSLARAALGVKTSD